MRIYIKFKNKFIRLNTDQLQEIGDGYEGNVYSYKEIAVKIKKNDDEVGLNYENAIKVRKVKTQRVLTPQNLIYNNPIRTKQNYIGYTTKLITPKQKNRLIYMKPDDLYNEIQILIKDVENLSSNRITIFDLDNDDNFIFDDKLYFVDPGCYEYVDTYAYTEIYNENMKELGDGLLINIFNIYDSSGFLADELVQTMGFEPSKVDDRLLTDISNIYHQYYFKNYYDNYHNNHAEFILKVLDKYGSLQKYKYELLKQYLSENNNDSDINMTLRKTIK